MEMTAVLSQLPLLSYATDYSREWEGLQSGRTCQLFFSQQAFIGMVAVRSWVGCCSIEQSLYLIGPTIDQDTQRRGQTRHSIEIHYPSGAVRRTHTVYMSWLRLRKFPASSSVSWVIYNIVHKEIHTAE